MIEIRIHGRGGQGVRKMAQILGRAAFLAGYKIQSFALYGAERAGAPVVSFVRIDKDKIGTRGYIFNPDYILIIDDTIEKKITLSGKKKNTKIIINTNRKIKHDCVVDATRIALEEIGSSLGSNMVLLGAFLNVFKLIKLEELEGAIRIELGKYSKELIDKNIKAAKKGYELVKCL